MLFAGIEMMIKNPELLKKRLNAKEEQAEQSLVIKLSGLMFLLGFVIAGLNYVLSGLCCQTGFRGQVQLYFYFRIFFMQKY